MKSIAVLGITGSIGSSTVEVVKRHPDKFKILLASTHNNTDLLKRYAQEFDIPYLAVTNKESDCSDFPSDKKLFIGENELLNLIAELPIDLVLNAISGSAGLLTSFKTISSDIDLALANKESLVLAGQLIKEEIKHSKSKILPVDSEHSAIFQCLQHHNSQQIGKIILTASGGPFRELPLDKFSEVDLSMTLKHPTWNMGTKVTIDSATMLNKGLEVIEAHWLFDTPYQNIEAVIHPQSIVHSFLQFSDGSILAQLSNPTMILPVLYAFSYPDHIDSDLVQTSILDLPQLTFSALSNDRYPLYFVARDCGIQSGIMPTIMNAVNEAAQKLFLDKKISFLDIHKLIDAACQSETNISDPSLSTIIEANREFHHKYLKHYKNYL